MAESQTMASGASYFGDCFGAVTDSAIDRGTSPLLSNNPFRNRIPSVSQNSAIQIQGARPISTNPFLDTTEIGTAQTTTVPDTAAANGRMSPEKKTAADTTTELFVGLTGAGRCWAWCGRLVVGDSVLIVTRISLTHLLSTGKSEFRGQVTTPSTST